MDSKVGTKGTRHERREGNRVLKGYARAGVGVKQKVCVWHGRSSLVAGVGRARQGCRCVVRIGGGICVQHTWQGTMVCMT